MPTTELLYGRVLALVREQPWAIRPEKLAAITDLLRFRAEGGRLTDEQIAARIGAAAERPAQRTSGAVAVIPVFGTIVQRADLFTEMSGGTSTERLSAAVSQAVADPSVGSIVLAIDSPGGGVYGVPELADQIMQARKQKTVVAVADSMAASAAYWIASAAGELVVTPSGEVGSIGVFAAHQDVSRLYESEGVTVSLISAGKYKTEGNPFEPLSEEARAAMQSRVDDYYAMFTKAVAKGRGVSIDTVRSGFGEGRMVGAQQAVKLGMADSIETLDAVISRLSGRSSRAAGQRAADDAPELVAAATVGLSDDSRRRRARYWR